MHDIKEKNQMIHNLNTCTRCPQDRYVNVSNPMGPYDSGRYALIWDPDMSHETISGFCACTDLCQIKFVIVIYFKNIRHLAFSLCYVPSDMSTMGICIENVAQTDI